MQNSVDQQTQCKAVGINVNALLLCQGVFPDRKWFLKVRREMVYIKLFVPVLLIKIKQGHMVHKYLPHHWAFCRKLGTCCNAKQITRSHTATIVGNVNFHCYLESITRTLSKYDNYYTGYRGEAM